MSKSLIQVFLCTGKDCSRAWRHITEGSPGKWLKRRVKEAGLPYKLNVIKTECMDRCDRAACLCLVHDEIAHLETKLRSPEDADRLLAAMRAAVVSGQK